MGYGLRIAKKVVICLILGILLLIFMYKPDIPQVIMQEPILKPYVVSAEYLLEDVSKRQEENSLTLESNITTTVTFLDNTETVNTLMVEKPETDVSLLDNITFIESNEYYVVSGTLEDNTKVSYYFDKGTKDFLFGEVELLNDTGEQITESIVSQIASNNNLDTTQAQNLTTVETVIETTLENNSNNSTSDTSIKEKILDGLSIIKQPDENNSFLIIFNNNVSVILTETVYETVEDTELYPSVNYDEVNLSLTSLPKEKTEVRNGIEYTLHLINNEYVVYGISAKIINVKYPTVENIITTLGSPTMEFNNNYYWEIVNGNNVLYVTISETTFSILYKEG